jgi:hypothetical protein
MSFISMKMFCLFIVPISNSMMHSDSGGCEASDRGASGSHTITEPQGGGGLARSGWAGDKMHGGER